MNDELRKPAVVDLDVLLEPLAGENPSGENLRYSGLYDEITEARRADDTLSRGDWVTADVKTADFSKVLDLAIPALSTRTKDLQIAAWAAEALIRQYGLVGLRDGLVMLHGFHVRFWESIHPEIDEGDMEGRANAISWFDLKGAEALGTAAITGAKGMSYNDLLDSRKYDLPDNVDSLSPEDQERIKKLRTEAERSGAVTAAAWAQERTATRRAPMESIDLTLEECRTAFNDLNRICEEKYDRNQTPGFSNLKKQMDDVQEVVSKLLAEKRIEEPDEAEADESIAAAEADDVGMSNGVSLSEGAIASRKEALRRLAEIAAFFQRTEPHSPVSYLVQRAVKWGNMGLESWLQEVIKDQSVLYQLRETLGVEDGNFSGSAPVQEEDPWASQ